MSPALLLAYLLCCLLLLGPHTVDSFTTGRSPASLHRGALQGADGHLSSAQVGRRGRVAALRMAPNPGPPFLLSKVVYSEREAEGLRTIGIEVADDVVKPFTQPGQYVQIKGTAPDAKAGFYAICSSPNKGNVLQFLIKDNENNAFVTKAPVGTDVMLTAASGRGFQFEQYFEKYKFDYAANTVIMMACGSGLAPIASYIDCENAGWGSMGMNSLTPRKGVLYIGAKTEKHLPLKSKYPEWEAKGVKVIPCISQPSNSPGWAGRTGYVQAALLADGIPAPRNCGALLCGHKDMTNAAKEVMLEAGIYEGRILFNF